MPEFVYEAMDATGKVTRGTRVAASEMDLHSALATMGFVLTRSKISATHSKVSKVGRVKPKHLISFSYHFVALFSAGVPLLQLLQDLAESTESLTLRKILPEIRDSVKEGVPLADTLEKYPKVFPPIYTNMVRAGEASGTLEDVLTRVSMYMEWQEETRGRLKQVMIYPAILGTAVTGVVILLLTFLIPKIQKIYETTGVELPIPTQIVIFCSKFLLNWWWLLAGVAVGGTLLYNVLYQTPKGRRTIDSLKLRFPMYGPLLRKSCASQFCNTLGNLFHSGVPIRQALNLTAATIQNVVISSAVNRTADAVTRGETLTDTLRQSGVFQSLVISMIAAGEKTGALDQTLARVNSFYDREIPNAIRQFVALFEPAIVVTAGGVVGFIVASVFLPIFKLVQVLR